MDFADVAAQREAQFRQEALARAGVKPAEAPSLEFCLECGSRIPERRRLAVPGVELCINCQEERENELI